MVYQTQTLVSSTFPKHSFQVWGSYGVVNLDETTRLIAPSEEQNNDDSRHSIKSWLNIQRIASSRYTGRIADSNGALECQAVRGIHAGKLQITSTMPGFYC